MSTEQKTAKDDAENIRYIQIPDPSSTGWPAMVRTVREADTNKIDDCKDDIDTLLVFAGLYSAVLSGFIIESYRNLQQDNVEIMVGLMQRLIVQNFVTGPGFINSTSSFPEIPPFEPPLWAIRVNVLWFTSLILSLAAASFGMLVKQWLREYLALDYTGPRERLRARQYRTPALAKWKVFEIAAILPILLQIALGLFFVGLCFFTSAIHSSVRNTTVPVVSAWAFLLLITTIAPLFSPRCPFKTTFLKATLKAGRRYAAPTSRYVIMFVRRCWHTVVRSVALRSAFRDTMTAARRSIFPLLWLIRSSSPAFQRFAEAIRAAIGVWGTLWNGSRQAMDSVKEMLTEEEDFVKMEQEDAEILTSVDSLMSDDGLLPTMLDALGQADPTSVITFVLQSIGRRIGESLPTHDLTTLLEFPSISRSTWSITTDGVAGTLDRYGKAPMRDESPPWVFDAVMILLSHSPFTLSKFAVRVLRDFTAQSVEANGSELARRLVRGMADKNSQQDLSHGLLQLREVQDGTLCVQPLLNMYNTLLCQDPEHQHNSLFQLFHQHVSEEFFTSSKAILDDLFNFILPLGRWITLTTERSIYGRAELIRMAIEYSGHLGREEDAVSLCRHMLLTGPYFAFWLSYLFFALHAKARLTIDREPVFMKAYLNAEYEVQQKIVTVTIKKLEDVFNGDYSVAKGWDQLDAVRMCRALLKVYVSNDNQVRKQWAGLWMTCAKVVQAYHENKDWDKGYINASWEVDSPLATPEELLSEDRVIACECLSIIQSHPELIVLPDAASSKGNGQVPGELVAALWLFVPEEEELRFAELKRLLPEHTVVPPPKVESGEPAKVEGVEEVKEDGESHHSEPEGGTEPLDTEE